MNWRQQQLEKLGKDFVIKQDQDLIDYITINKIKTAVGIGPVGYFSDHVQFVRPPAKFLIYIVNERFDFLNLLDHVNHHLTHSLIKDGVMYLALNKFYAWPIEYFKHGQADYDQSIYDFFADNIKGKILSYKFNANDDGTFFNFVHPLTQLYMVAE